MRMRSGRAPGPATIRAAWTAAALACIIATFHAAVALGAPWGEYTQGGGRAGQGPLAWLPDRVRTVLAWVATVYAVVGVVLNLITRSASERALWAPVAIVLLGLVAFVMLTTRRRPGVDLVG